MASFGPILERYQRAQELLGAILGASGLNAEVLPRWLGDSDSFWYERVSPGLRQYRLVDAEAGQERPLFDADRLAARLSAACGAEVDPGEPPLSRPQVSPDGTVVSFTAFGRAWDYRPADDALSELAQARGSFDWLPSPDGRLAAFLRDHNLWVRDLASGEERALTEDGVAYHAYGTLPDRISGLKLSFGDLFAFPPEAVWSSDSRMLLTLRTDERRVEPLPIVEFAPKSGAVRPRSMQLRTPWPGDENVTEFSIVAVDVATGRICEAQYPAVPDVRMSPTLIAGGLAWWGADDRLAYFVDVARGEQSARVVEFDPSSGACRVLFEERSRTYLDFNIGMDHGPASILVLPKTNELIWFSERTGWGHLYLYDLATGQLKNAITRGEWVVRDLLHFDEATRELVFSAAGRVEGRDPYYREICRVQVDGGEVVPLVSSDHDHVVFKWPGDRTYRAFGGDPRVRGMSPTGRFFVDTYSRADALPVSVLRGRDGAAVMELAAIGPDALPAAWGFPERVQTVADDGQPLFGLLFKPPGLDEGLPRPVLNFVYGGPQLNFVPKGMSECFARYVYFQAAAFAALGFAVVLIDGRGTAGRSKSFHDASYGRVQTASNLQDHIASIRQLAASRPYMDLDRVGVVGISGGGYLATRAMLEYPEFYKVGVAAGGNHDQRAFWLSWGERYQGLPDAAEANYIQQANASLADRLRGKLLLIHGLLDSGCHPAALFQLVEAFIQANVDFDLLALPNAGHAWTDYGMRRCWDYLVQHLGQETPPPRFNLITGANGIL